MEIVSLKTENFRLLAAQTVEFSPEVNVISGANAQGKTTLLEAAYLLTGLRSFRSRYDRELICFDQPEALVDGRVQAAGRAQRVELRFYRGRARLIRQNGVRRSPSEVTEALKAVLFSPEDLGLVRGPAAGRRKLLDSAISQLRPGYGALLADYARLYENKLRILRDWREKPSLLDPLEEFSRSLCLYSARLIRYRASFAARLAALAGPIHREFSGGGEKLEIRYETVSTVTDPTASEKAILEEILQRQEALSRAELESGQCLVGAHKDDLAITVDGADARTFASQGQTRTAALSLKLAERELFLEETGEAPVLLLDDVLSELDPFRQEFVLNRIGGGQTLITCCDEATVSRLTGGRVLRMEKGRVV